MSKKKRSAYLREVEIKYKLKKIDSDIIGSAATDPKTVVELFSDLQNAAKEKLITICLDARHKILCFEVVAIGSVDAIYLKPAEVFRTAVVFGAHAVIVMHNHPSGDPAPSKADREFTKEIENGLLGIHFYDHIIVGFDSYYTFALEKLVEFPQKL